MFGWHTKKDTSRLLPPPLMGVTNPHFVFFGGEEADARTSVVDTNVSIFVGVVEPFSSHSGDHRYNDCFLSGRQFVVR